MSIKFLYSSEKTNSWRPEPWHWSTEKFPAYRGNGWRHRSFLAVVKDYAPQFASDPSPAYTSYVSQVGFDPTASKLVKTQAKGTLLLVPCSPEQDEQVMLITLRGGFRGGYSRIEGKGVEILAQDTSGGHCVVTGHMIVRLTHPNGFVYAETGRRSSYGLVEIFSWDGYKTMPTEEFEAWLVGSAPDLTEATRAEANAKAEAERMAGMVTAEERRVKQKAEAQAKTDAEEARKANAERMKPILLPQLEAIARRREALGMSGMVKEDLYFFFGGGYRLDYTEESLQKVEVEVAEAEVKAAMKQQLDALQERIDGHNLVIYPDNGDNPSFIVREAEGYANYFGYTNEGLRRLLAFLNQLDAKAADAKVKADAEVVLNARYAEAASLGLPSNVEIWRRRGGATKAGDGWVIQSNGMPRERDEMLCPRPRYLNEGTQVWKQILPGELVIRWSKVMTAAEHVFEVVCKPETLTDAQLRTVALLQEELAEAYEGARGMSSGDSSPLVGEGWGLLPQTPPPSPVTPVSKGGSAASAETLAALRDRFKK